MLSCAGALYYRLAPSTVARVIDGDTVVLSTGARVRLAGIDAPELRQPFGPEAKHYLAGLVLDRSVVLIVSDTDRYGRMVATLEVEGRDINLAMIEAGLAWHFKRYDSSPAYAAAELEARKTKLGLWSQPSLPPWEWRGKSAGRN